MKNYFKKAFTYLLLAMSMLGANGQELKRRVVSGVSDAYPVMSNDGKRIVFHTERFGASEICIMNADGTDMTRLTFNNTPDNSPQWSPDDSKIVFASERDGNSEIYIMDADGKNQRRITTSWGDDAHPKFYDNGKRIVFNSPRYTKDTTLPWSRQTMEIFTMNIDGSDVKQLTHFNKFCTYPSISPDGTKLIYRYAPTEPGFNWDLTTSSRNSEVFVMNLDGTNVINLSKNPAYDGWPAWTPDGKIVFSSNRGGVPYSGQLYLVNPDGSGLMQLTDRNVSYTQPAVSRDGKFIICQNDISGTDFDYGGIVILNLITTK